MRKEKKENTVSCSKTAQRNCLLFLKTFKHSVNETKLILGNSLIVDLFTLWGEKESKDDERTLFWGSPWKLDLPLNT